jgi:hypothetical protein
MSNTKNKIKINNELFSEEDFLKDCPSDDHIPTILPSAERIIVIGDIHGDYDLAKRSFEVAGLINKNDTELNWVADPPNTIVVQVGDQIDSCRPVNVGGYNCHNSKQKDDIAEDIKVLDFFNQMHEKAKRVGGAVYSLLGNHELMNASGDFDYVSYENYYNYQYVDKNNVKHEGPPGRKSSFKPGGPVANMLACKRTSVLIIGSNIFLHAGLLPGLVRRLDYLNLDDRTKLKYLNRIVRKWLLNKMSPNRDKEATTEKDDIDVVLGKDIRVLGSGKKTLSPFWTRAFGDIKVGEKMDSTKCKEALENVLQVLKIGQIIVGHTPQLFNQNDGINGTCNDGIINRVYRVDGGFSRGFKIWSHSNLVQVLEIKDDNKFNVISDPGSTDISNIPEFDISDTYVGDIAKIYSQDQNSTENSTSSRISSSKKKKNIKKRIY